MNANNKSISKYKLHWHTPPLPRKTLCVFPGQGFATPGMCKEMLEYSLFRSFFDRADILAAQKGIAPISLYLTEHEKIPQSHFYICQNLALFVAEIALFEAHKHLAQSSVVVGHSLGEFTALAATNLLSFDQTFNLILEKEVLSGQPFVRGKLIATKADLNQINKHIDSNLIALRNSKNQIVLAAALKDIPKLEKTLTDAKIKHKILEVPHPYHSYLVSDVRKKLEAYVERNISITQPLTLDFYSIAKQELYPKSGTISKLELSQIVGNLIDTMLDFYDAVQQAKMRTEKTLCFDPTKKFHTLLKHSLDDASIIISIPTGKKKADNPKTSSQIGEKISQIISKVTGYKVESISVEDRFVEDLGVDSITKGEIVFEYLDHKKIPAKDDLNLSSLKTVHDVIAYAEETTQSKVFLHEEQAFITYAVQEAKIGDKNIPKTNVVLKTQHVLNGKKVDCKNKTLSFAIYKNDVPNNKNFLYESIKWIQLNAEQLSLAKGIVCVHDDSIEGHFFAGALKSLTKEYNIDWFYEYIVPVRFSLVAKEKSKSKLTKGMHIFNKYETKTRKQVFEKTIQTSKNADQTYENVVAFGGAKGLTRLCIENLSGCKNIWIVGASPEQQIGENLQKIKELTKANIRYIQCNVREQNHESIFQGIDAASIDLCVHGAGVQHSKKITAFSDEEIKEQIDVKLCTMRIIAQIAQSIPIKQLVVFSSITGLFGNGGQVIYGAANNALRHYLHRKPKNIASYKIIHWPPVADTGMTESKAIQAAIKEKGIHLLPKENVANVLLHILSNEEKEYAAMPGDLDIAVLMQRDKNTENEFENIQKFAHEISGQTTVTASSWAKYHKMNNTVVIPAAYFLDKLLRFSKEVLEKSIVRNFVMYRRCIVDEEKQLQFKFARDESINVFVSDEKQICTASLNGKTLSAKPSKIMTQAVMQGASKNFYGPTKLFHTGVFQTLEYFSSNKDAADAKTNIKSDKIAQMLALDSVFQIAGVIGLQEERMLLPVSIKHCQANQKVSKGKYDIQLKNIKQTEQSMTFDAIVYNKQAIFLVLSGVTMQVANV